MIDKLDNKLKKKKQNENPNNNSIRVENAYIKYNLIKWAEKNEENIYTNNKEKFNEKFNF